MAGAKIFFWSNMLLLLSFIITAITGIVLFLFLPSGQPGAGQRGLVEFFRITKNTWMVWHNWAGIAMIFLVVIHIILFWKPLTAMGRNAFAKK